MAILVDRASRRWRALAVFVSVSGSATFLSERARLQSYDTSRFSAQESGLSGSSRPTRSVSGPASSSRYCADLGAQHLRPRARRAGRARAA